MHMGACGANSCRLDIGSNGYVQQYVVFYGFLFLRGVVVKGKILTGGHHRIPPGNSCSRLSEDGYTSFNESDCEMGFPFHTDSQLSTQSRKQADGQDVSCLLAGWEGRPAAFREECHIFVVVFEPVDNVQCVHRRIGTAKWPRPSRIFDGCTPQRLEIEWLVQIELFIQSLHLY